MRRLLVAFFLVAILSGWISLPSVRAELIRKPVWAGRFYSADGSTLAREIDALGRKAASSPLRPPRDRPLRALILPHAGYVYSGWTAAHAIRAIGTGDYDKVLLLGPDHRVGFAEAAVSEAMAWETPLGLVHLHPDARRLREGSPRFRSVPESDRTEHSLEVVLPFLQRSIDRFTLVPVVVGNAEPEVLAAELAPLVDDGTLVVISSDLSHYLPYERAVRVDRETVERILALSADEIMARRDRACGAVPVAVGIHLAQRFRWKPVLLHYANSGDTAGDRERVVGYAAIAFYGEAMSETNQSFDETQGQLLVELARNTLENRFGRSASGAPDGERLSDPRFDVRRGTFVTLKLEGRLRGCIGSLTGEEPVRENVRRNAVNAAFHDPRFAPLSAEELDRLQIEVSVLSEPRPLSYTDADDLISRLRPGVDGVIIRQGPAQATFLPQVWEQLPQPEPFLEHLCRKAGLPGDAWRGGSLQVFTYQVQYFEEPR